MVLQLLNPLIRPPAYHCSNQSFRAFFSYVTFFFSLSGQNSIRCHWFIFLFWNQALFFTCEILKNCMRLFNYQDFSLTKTNRFVNRRFTFYENNGHQKQQEKAKLHGQEFSSLNWIAKGSDNCAVIWSATRSNLEHLTRIVLEKPILPASPSHMCTRQNDIRPLKRRHKAGATWFTRKTE